MENPPNANGEIKKRTKRSKGKWTGVTGVTGVAEGGGVVGGGGVGVGEAENKNIHITFEECVLLSETATVAAPAPSPPSAAEEPTVPVTGTSTEEIIKKRGRKPKGGKLKSKQTDTVSTQKPIANIILHLKCSLHDVNEYNHKISKLLTNPMEYNPSVPPDILTYNNDGDHHFCPYEKEINRDLAYQANANDAGGAASKTAGHVPKNDDENVNIKEINAKLKKLKINLYKNVNMDKSSACFWCTYEYDNAPCYIPKYEADDTVCGYGSFCRPECAVAYLMKENIDDTTKFERYFLLNKIYGKVYDYKKNIKPAPNPHYLLDKYYGNLTIQEYRKLLKTEHMLLTIEKPMTRILPELHEDNEDLMLNIRGNATSSNPSSGGGGVYKVRRQSEKPQGPSKTSIIKDKFGLQ